MKKYNHNKENEKNERNVKSAGLSELYPLKARVRIYV